MNLNLYKPELNHTGFSVFTGGETVSGVIHYSEIEKIPVLKTFLDDDDLQEITVTSANIGFSRTYTKLYVYRTSK